MKAFVVEKWGEPELFTEVELTKPEIGVNQILIQVEATSVNPVDYKIRRFGPEIAPALPAVLHGDVAGIVAEVGANVTQFKPGDQVYACAGGLRGYGGALADYMATDVDFVARKPANLTMAQAAALPLVTITAWEGLFDMAKLQAGQKILVQGATGGVGHIVIQLAKWAGATVYAAVSSAEKAKIAKALGADYTINYREQTVAHYVQEYTDGAGFDVVFDTAGGQSLTSSFQAAKLYGTVITIQSNSQQDLGIMQTRQLTLHSVFMLIPMLYKVRQAHHGEILRETTRLVEEGLLQPLLDEWIYNFSEVAQAHRRVEAGQHIGKVVLTRR